MAVFDFNTLNYFIGDNNPRISLGEEMGVVPFNFENRRGFACHGDGPRSK